MKRILLVLGGVTAGLLAGEVVMRLVYSQPAVVMDMERIAAQANRFSRPPARLEGAFNLAVVGDSVVEGIGAPKGRGMAEVLGRLLGRSTGLQVEVINSGRPGANFMHKAQMSKKILDSGAADALVVVLFSDDLHFSLVVAEKGKVVDLLDKQPSLLMRTLIRRSYLANALWMLWRTSVHQTQTQFLSGEHRARLVGLMREVKQRARQSKTPLVMAILPASGVAVCPRRPLQGTPCSVVLLTMETMAELLQEAGMPFVDLRYIWADGRPRAPQYELDDVRSGRLGIAVHPDTEGHSMIAEALEPVLTKAVLKRPLRRRAR